MKRILILIVAFSLGIVFQSNAQRGRVITGKVFDENGAVMAGANILEKNTKNGTVTNSEGEFSLTLTTNRHDLEITYIGYAPKTVLLGNSNVIEVRLDPDENSLNQVVVVGYGTQKKASLVGAISQVSAEDLKKSFTPNLTNSLAGKSGRHYYCYG